MLVAAAMLPAPSEAQQITAAPEIVATTPTSATVRWTTDVPTDATIRAGEAPGAYTITIDANHTRPAPGGYETNHVITVPGLSPGTRYYFQVTSADASGNVAGPSPEASFVTQGLIAIQSMSLAAGPASAVLDLVTDVAATATISYGSAPGSLTSERTGPAGTVHSARLAGLSPGRTVYYQVRLSSPGRGERVYPVARFVTPPRESLAREVVHATGQDFESAVRTNVRLGAGAPLLELERQGVPAMPLTGSGAGAPDLPQPLYYHGTAVLGGYLYVVGGRTSGGAAQSTVYVAAIGADGRLSAWRSTTPLPAPASLVGDSVFGYNRRLYVVGGADSAGRVQTSVLYASQNSDGTLGPWSAGTPLSGPEALHQERDQGSAVVVDGCIVLSGGENAAGDQQPTNLVSPLNADGSNGPWRETSALASERWFQRTLANGHMVYSEGGYGSRTGFNSRVELARLSAGETDRFTPVTDLPGHGGDWMDTGRFSMAAGLLRGKIVNAAGRTYSNSNVTTIAASRINADGSTGPWKVQMGTDGAPLSYPAGYLAGGQYGGVIDLSGRAWNGRLYATGGRPAFTGTAATASVVVVPMVDDPSDAGYATSGTIESPVIDFGTLAALRRIKVSASVPAGVVEVRYRFAGLDGVFSDWMAPAGLDAEISGGARFVQYELVMHAGGGAAGNELSPAVESVAVSVGPTAAFTPADAALALQAAAGLRAPGPLDVVRLDTDGDGVLGVEDAAAILRAAG